MDKKLKTIKDDLIKAHLTEDLHHGLEKLKPEESKLIVESLTNEEINIKVNNRKFQEDYIADYLEFLWTISEGAFWKHVEILLDSYEGVLWSDNMFYIEKMCSIPLSNNILKLLINFINVNKKLNSLDFDIIGDVIKAQIEKFNKKDDINILINTLSLTDQEILNQKITEITKRDYKYNGTN